MIPFIENPPVPEYNQFAGTLVATLAVSPAQAVNNAIHSTFHPDIGERFKVVTKYLHGVCDLPQLALDIDELDNPIQQRGLFGGTISSHRRRDETRLAKLISERYKIPNNGEKSLPRIISRKFIAHRRRHP